VLLWSPKKSTLGKTFLTVHYNDIYFKAALNFASTQGNFLLLNVAKIGKNGPKNVIVPKLFNVFHDLKNMKIAEKV
jgi:hypothetical protein